MTRLIHDFSAGETGPPITADSVEDWLRHARLRATNLFYLASDPSPEHQQRALAEMTNALREALEEVRVVAEEMRRRDSLRGRSGARDEEATGDTALDDRIGESGDRAV